MTQADDPLAYYASPGPMTDPGPYASLFAGLPSAIPELVQVVQGLLVHVFWAERYGLSLPDERKGEVQLRLVADKLARIRQLDARPLAEPRPLESKLVGNCRDFSVMLCAMLRCQGIPARARAGFGTYFMPGHYEDHWVCEYWHAGERRWVMVDAQLDALQCQVLGIDFDPLDVPPGRFVTGGRAWQMCAAGEADPESFGIFDMHGLWFVRGDLLRDFIALNKLEILPWDGGWGFLTAEAEVESELMDRLAALTLAGDGSLPEIQALYAADPRFHVPPEYLAPGSSPG
ncbi:MAG TPA: transglutaminase-like domain-containing protein [Anaerolineae bacterium]|nr:transglutaminase-like domain-containing protein [Anaerolineae bacterium]